MSEFWKQLALNVTPTLIAGTVILYLRSYISQNFARELAQLKSDLALRDFKLKEKFSGIYQKRLEIISELYGRLKGTNMLIAGLVWTFQSGGQNLPEKMRKANNSFNDTSSYFDQIRLFLPKSPAEKMDVFLDTHRTALIKFDISQGGNDGYTKDDSGLWRESYKSVRDDIPPILKELESEFKIVLGILEGSTDSKQLDSGSSPE